MYAEQYSEAEEIYLKGLELVDQEEERSLNEHRKEILAKLVELYERWDRTDRAVVYAERLNSISSN